MKIKKQQGKASPAVITLVALVVTIVLIAVAIGVSYVGASNYGAAKEAEIKAASRNSENVLAQYGQTLLESVQIPAMARDDIVKVATAAVGGRYGPDGSRAAVQMIREQNPSVDPQIYTRIQNHIEGGRKEFQQSNTKVLDICQGYETSRNLFWRGKMLALAGYPKMDLKMCDIVSTDRAQEAFKNGKESGPITLRSEPVPN